MLMVPSNKRKFFVGYCLVSYATTLFIVYHTVFNSTSYLAASIRLLKGIPLILVCNFTLVNGLLLWQLAIYLLFGELRLIETEHIFENLGFTIVNGIFLSSSLREHEFFSGIVLISLSISLKVLHWILADRLEHLYHGSNNSLPLRRYIFSKFHFNLFLFLILDFQLARLCFDQSFLMNSYFDIKSMLTSEVPFYLIFSLSFGIMFVGLLNLLANSLLNLYEIFRTKAIARQMNAGNNHVGDDNNDDIGLDEELIDDEPFENKYRWQVSIDIITSFLKITMRLIIAIPLQFPIVIIKDLVLDLLSLFNNSKKLYAILKNSHRLNALLPDCVPEDITEDNDLCTICMDDLLTASSKGKKLPCGHIFHLHCLKHWLERSQTCPICRVDVFDASGRVANNSFNTRRQSAANNSNNNDNDAGYERNPMDVPNGLAENTHDHQNSESERPTPTPTSHTDAHTSELSATSNNATSTQEQDPHQKTWIPYEINTDSGNIVFQNTIGKEVNAVLKKRIRSDYEVEDLGNNIRKVVIPAPVTNNNEQSDLEALKRKIDDLQQQIDELTSKKFKKE